MRFAVERIGWWCDETEFKVDAEHAIAYAAATNDPTAAHRDGTLAPPVFAVLAMWEPLKRVVAAVVPPEAMLDILHGEQDIRIHRPMQPGMVLRTTGAVIGMHVKSSGTTLVKQFVSRDAESGELVLEQFTVSFLRDVFGGSSCGEQAPPHRFPESLRAGEPIAIVEQTFDHDQTFRFAEASGDDQRFHLDDAEARDAGFPGIIVQGMCTMAFAGWAAVAHLADGDPTRLRRIAARLSRPVLRGATITTRFHDVGRAGPHRGYAFETVAAADGGVVLGDGVVEIAR